MNGIKLIDKSTKELVSVDPGEVSAAISSGKFSFDKNSKYPIVHDGTPMWVSSSYAAKYADRINFTTDDDVKTFNAEQKMRGVLPKLGAAAYGVGTAATLGALPLGIEALGGEAGKQLVETVERGAPKYVLGGEAIGSFIDPFALAGRIGQRAVAKGVAHTVAEEAAQAARAAVPEAALGKAAMRAPVQAPEAVAAQVAEEAAQVGRGPIAAEVSAPALGRQALAPTPAEAAQLATRARFEQIAKDVKAAQAASAEAEAQSLAYRPLTGPTSPAEPGIRIPSPYDTSELALRARQADELMARTRAARAASETLGQEAATMRLGMAPGEYGPAQAVASLPMEEQAAVLARMAEMQAGAPARAAQAERMGRMAGELEAANVSPQVLGRVASRVEAATAEGARPLGEVGTMPRELPQPRLGVPAVEEAALPAVTEAAALPAAAEAVMPAAQAAAPAAAGKSRMAELAPFAAQTGAYGTLRTLGRQEAGLEEGGLPEALRAGAMGAALTPLLGVGGKVAGEATGLGKRGFREVLAKGAAALEESGILRTFGISAAQAGKVQRLFYNPELETLGTRELTNFAKDAFANVGALKALPENEGNLLLQGIRPEKGFGALSSDEKIAFTRALNQSLNKTRNDVFAQVGNPVLSDADVGALMRHGVAEVGTAGKGITEIRPFLNEIAEARAAGGQFALEDLQRMKTAFGQQMEQAHTTNPWRKEEIAFYNELKNVIQRKVGEASPELLTTLKAIDKASTMGIELEKGAAKLAAKLAVAQTVGPDTLAQVGLGAFAMKRVLDAIQFGVGAVALKAINLHRGDGIIADLSGNFAQKVATNPQAAAQEVTQSVLRAKSPQMSAMVARSFVDASPQSYSGISSLVRQLQDERDKVKSQMQQQLGSMSPEQANAVVSSLDAKINALAAAQPKGLATEQSLTEQQKNYVLFARGVLDPAYAVQVLMNGGDGTDQAAKALQATPGGKEMLQSLQQQFKSALDENAKLRDDKAVVDIARTMKRYGGKSIGSIALLHAPAGQPQPPQGGKGVPKLGATAEKAAAASLGSVYKTGTP